MSLGNIEKGTAGIKQQAKELIEQAYQRGYKAGQENALTVDSDKYREQGRNEAWEAARYCVNIDEAREYNYAFDGCIAKEIFEKYTAFEAIEKIRAYEEQKKQKEEEICIGDEVAFISDPETKFVVTRVKKERIYGMNVDGEFSHREINYWEKTGRQFPQIAEVLKKMQEGE